MVNIGSDMIFYISGNKWYMAADELEQGMLMEGDNNFTDKGYADGGWRYNWY